MVTYTVFAAGLDGGVASSSGRFPPAFAEAVAGESREGRKARMDAYAACWSAMKTGFEVQMRTLSRQAATQSVQMPMGSGPALILLLNRSWQTVLHPRVKTLNPDTH